MHFSERKEYKNECSECLSTHPQTSIISTDLLTAADSGGVGPSISLSVLIEFIITSGNSTASTPLWLRNTHTLILASFTNQLSHFPSLSLSISTLWLPWEWVDHTDLIRQPCNDEICTTGPSVPSRMYSRDSRSELALARGRSEAAGWSLRSDFGRGTAFGSAVSQSEADWERLAMGCGERGRGPCGKGWEGGRYCRWIKWRQSVCVWGEKVQRQILSDVKRPSVEGNAEQKCIKSLPSHWHYTGSPTSQSIDSLCIILSHRVCYLIVPVSYFREFIKCHSVPSKCFLKVIPNLLWK